MSEQKQITFWQHVKIRLGETACLLLAGFWLLLALQSFFLGDKIFAVLGFAACFRFVIDVSKVKKMVIEDV